jgi:predicted secreted hydrolase
MPLLFVVTRHADIAVLTDNAASDICYPTSTSCTKRCEYYMNNTMNWNKKGYCDVSHNVTHTVDTKLTSSKWKNNQWYNNRLSCESAGFDWFEISHLENLNLGNNR